MKQILVTDTLFIFDEHEARLAKAGYKVVRVEKPDSTEEELIKHIKGKVGYILGGIETITEPVIKRADELQAIVFTGTGWEGYISGWQKAKEQGIKIGRTPYANIYEVAEWGVASTLAMQRNLFELGPNGTKTFSTVTSLPDLTVGIVGLGHIGRQYADMMSALGAKEVMYWSRKEKDAPYGYASFEELFSSCDIIFVSVGDAAGKKFIGKDKLDLMKDNALIVSISHKGVIDERHLAELLKNKKVRAAMDIVKEQDLFEGISPRSWYGSNSSAAYNSSSFLHRASDMAVDTLINLLETGEDKNRVV